MKTKTKSKPKAPRKKSATQRRPKRRKPVSASSLGALRSPAGALVLGTALLALLAAFHVARARLAPAHKAPVSAIASLPEPTLGH